MTNRPPKMRLRQFVDHAAGIWILFFALLGLAWLMVGENNAALTHWMWMSCLLVPFVILWLNRRAVRALSVQSYAVLPVHENERALVVGWIKNQSSKTIESVSLLDHPGFGPANTLSPGQTQDFTITLPPLSRGIHERPAPAATTKYPFDLFYAQIKSPPVITVVVYPALEEQAPPYEMRLQDSERAARFGEEVLGVREHRHGDALNSIDWKKTAQIGDLMVRERATPHQPAVIFDLNDVMHLEFEAGLRRLAAWLLQAHLRGHRFGLNLGVVQLELGDGADHLHACWRALAALPAKPLHDDESKDKKEAP